jgi:hypothetical protein
MSRWRNESMLRFDCHSYCCTKSSSRSMLQ